MFFVSLITQNITRKSIRSSTPLNVSNVVLNARSADTNTTHTVTFAPIIRSEHTAYATLEIYLFNAKQTVAICSSIPPPSIAIRPPSHPRGFSNCFVIVRRPYFAMPKPPPTRQATARKTNIVDALAHSRTIHMSALVRWCDYIFVNLRCYDLSRRGGGGGAARRTAPTPT